MESLSGGQQNWTWHLEYGRREAGNKPVCEDQAGVGFKAPPQKQDPNDENEQALF